MPYEYSQHVKMSSLHNGIIVTGCDFGDIHRMAIDAKAVKNRTYLVRRALGLGTTQLSKELGISLNAWTQYENPQDKRLITLDVAIRLKERYQISLDWLYFGERLADLPGSIQTRLRESA